MERGSSDQGAGAGTEIQGVATEVGGVDGKEKTSSGEGGGI